MLDPTTATGTPAGVVATANEETAAAELAALAPRAEAVRVTALSAVLEHLIGGGR